MFMSVANGAVTLSKNMDNAFKAPDLQNFIKWMNNNAGQAFVTFGNIAGNVMRTVMNLIVAFGPLGNDMAASMEKATASWAKWAAGLSSSQRFQDFVAYTRENGPKLLKVITNFSGALRRLFAAFGPMSADMLTSLVDMTARFREWAGTVQHTEGFKNFIAYIEKTGPTVWSTLGQIARTVINLLVGMAPLGKTILENVNSFLKFSNAAMETNPIIGQLIAGFLSTIGVVRALTPMIVSFSTLFLKWKDIVAIATKVGSAIKLIGTVFGVVSKIFMANPILLAIAAIGTAVFLVIKYWEPISKFFIDLWNKVTSFTVIAGNASPLVSTVAVARTALSAITSLN
ncbi:hypothetical protein Saga11_21330 [Bacillus safensis]|nr:hypothetical protein Saga11_21330 [Bacillus safensis]